VGNGQRYEVLAHNTATTSMNKIHDDDVARRYGFGGGLVPGVDVYAYMTRPAVAVWGLDWLAGGTMHARFVSPVYDGRTVVVTAGEPTPAPAGPTLAIEVRADDGTLCASGEAGLHDRDGDPPSASAWPDAAPAARPPEASPDSLAPGTPLGLPAHRFHAREAGAYLADVREVLPLYGDGGVAHPGWLLRDANHVLSGNVRLGPWIHVESRVRNFSLVRDGDAVAPRAVVTREWEHKGHRFVELDVGLLADGERPVAHVIHTAIYRPREPAAS
jgi:hypothetical protein